MDAYIQTGKEGGKKKRGRNASKFGIHSTRTNDFETLLNKIGRRGWREAEGEKEREIWKLGEWESGTRGR
eukprot:1118597-Amorphochlora_amoeboformis.AAC.1